MAKVIVYGEEFRRRMRAGMDRLADAVKPTLGPNGRNAVMYRKAERQGAEYGDRAMAGAKAMVLNDGVTIAKGIVLEDPVEELGARLLREASQTTNDLAGDGTTTAVVLTQAIVNRSMTLLASGAHPLLLNRGIRGAARAAVEALAAQAQPVDTLQALSGVAAISCQDAALGEIVGRALHSVGPEGVVEIEDGGRRETRMELLEGIVFERGFLSPMMCTDAGRTEAVLEEPLILLYDGKFTSSQTLLSVMLVAAEADRPLLLICDGLEDDAMALVLKNKLHGDMQVVAVQPPLYGDGRRWRMEDMAVQTGARLVSRDFGLDVQDVTLDWLGSARQVRVTKNQTVITDPGGDPAVVEQRIRELRYMVGHTDYAFNRERYRERLAKFVSGVAKIQVGGLTELEITERKFRVEDAVAAARAAWEEGVVPGGGTALLRVAPAACAWAQTREGDERAGGMLLAGALESPLRQIAANSGVDGSVVVGTLKELPAEMGYDAVNDRYVDMVAAGILDPAKVTRLVLENAVSVASTLLTSEACMVDTNEKGGDHA